MEEKYQFIRISAVSNAGRDIYRKINGKKVKVGHESVSSVLGESGRLEPYIAHIGNPLAPVTLYGDKEKGVEAVREKFKKWAEETKDALGHKIRIDANGLLSIVISWPPLFDGDDINVYILEMKAFEQRMLEELKKKYGEDLILVLRHDDEPFKGVHAGQIHYHWHIFCVKRPGVRFDLHPGFKERAKYNISRKDRVNMTKEEKEKQNKAGMQAYGDAMKSYQDWFHAALGKEFGLKRFGPMRIRRSRNEQVELEKYVEKIITEANLLKDETVSIKFEAEKILTEAKREKNEAERIWAEAMSQKKEANALKAKANVEKLEAEKRLKAAKNEAASIIEKAEDEAKVMKERSWIEGNDIIKAAEDQAEADAKKVIEKAEADAKKMKEKAWRDASIITKAAQKYADKIVKTIDKIIESLLDEASKLPGSKPIVKKVRDFLSTLHGLVQKPTPIIIKKGEEDNKVIKR
jgi:hypothetical protein